MFTDTDPSTGIGRPTVTAAKMIMESKRAMVVLQIMLMGIIKEEIKIVFIIIRCQDFLVEFKVGEF